MKNISNLFMVLAAFLFSSSLSAQNRLEKEYNMFRDKDVILKQQVKYKHPGRAGANVLWDFSKQEAVNGKYKVSFTQVDSTVTGCEHRTLYHYLLRNDSLYSLGYENPTTLMQYQKPELLLTFPFSYQKRVEGYFYGNGSYCRCLDLAALGKTVTWGDAHGMIILPNGDTLQHVLRVRSLKTIAEKMLRYEPEDSVAHPILSQDSIEHRLNNDSVYIQVETYRWYADGYRYPIFETVESTTYKNRKPLKIFNTAFFYSPEKHVYLNEDEKNLARLEELDKADKAAKEKTSGENGNSNDNNHSNPDNDIINYNVYIENGSNTISVEYNLKQPAEVAINLFDMQGRLLANYPKKNCSPGCYQESISLDGYQLGEYLLRIVVNGYVYGEKIAKQN